jgi:hypothetical protein
MNRKPVVLGTALLLPVIFFLALKFFGSNQFDVSPLYHEPVESIDSMCGEFQFPYEVSKEVQARLVGDSDDRFVVLIFVPLTESHGVEVQSLRAMDEFKNDTLGFRIITTSANRTNEPAMSKAIILDHHQIQTYRQCTFFLNETQDAVVIDKLGRIRGQYDLNYLDDADRLILELEILLEKY